MNRTLIFLLAPAMAGLAFSMQLRAAGTVGGGGARQVVQPRDTGQALVNPDMGWTLMFYSNVPDNYGSKLDPDDTVDEWPGLSVVYLRVPWAFIEPEEGRFNWPLLDTPAQRWSAKGKRVAFRITCSENWMKFATPEWVKKAGAKGVRYAWGTGPTNTGALWDPDFADPVFIAKLDTFLKAMAARYDGNPNVAFIDIGSYGMWGEGHTGGSSKVPQDRADHIVCQHIDLHLKWFKHTRLAINDDVAGPSATGDHFPTTDYAASKGIMLRDDSICVQPPPNSWYHAGMAQLFWPTVPVIVEHEHYGSSKQRGAWGDGSLLVRAVEEYHASYLTIHWWPREMLAETRAVVDSINRRLGYRLQLREIAWPQQIVVGESFTVDSRWANTGVAPCYPGGFMALTLKNDRNGIAAVLADETLDMRALQPGPTNSIPVAAHTSTFTAGRIAPALKPGTYTVHVSVGRRDGTPVIALPLEGDDGQHRYLLGTITVVAAKPLSADEEKQMKTQAIVTIDTDSPSKPYSPMIFGGFLEHFDRQVYGGVFEPGSPLSDKKGFRKDVMAALKELKIPVVRWPGGCYVSGYHWEAGVGRKRKPTDDMAWGVVEPNTFGTDEYVELCRLMGWEPYICNNAGNGTVEEMRNWVEYCNATDGKYAQMRKASGYGKPRNVIIWSIGNENWGQHEIGYKPIEQWAQLVLGAAKAMKSADPHIQLTAAALPSREWTLPLLKAAGQYLDYISIHAYWLGFWGQNEMPEYLTCIMTADSPEKTIADFTGVLDESGFRGRIKIAFDEWNLRGWHHPGFPRKEVQKYNDPEVIKLVAARAKNDIASQYTMADALFSASFLNACLRHAEDVGMANIAPIVNTRGPLYVHPKGIVKRTHFHTMAMYANELEDRVGTLDIKADKLAHGDKSVSLVDAIATVNKSGRNWAIALVNRHPDKEVACTVKMKDKLVEGTFDAIVLSGDSAEAYNDIEHPNRVVPEKTKATCGRGVVSLPPHSLTIVKVGLDH